MCNFWKSNISFINLRRLSADMSARTSVVVIFEHYQVSSNNLYQSHRALLKGAMDFVLITTYFFLIIENRLVSVPLIDDMHKYSANSI